MKLIVKFVAAAIISFTSFACSNDYPQANFIFHSGEIYTVDEKKPWAKAVVVHENTITFVGDVPTALRYKGQETTLIDVKDNLILPGFIDSHVHPIMAGRALSKVNLRAAMNKEDFQATLRRFRNEHPEAPFIIGGGWVMENFGEEHPNKGWIDEIISDVPVLLYDHFVHSALVNTVTLKKSNITLETPNPFGGIIVRDNEGIATGILREHPSFELVLDLFFENTAEMDYQALTSAISHLNQFGITSIVSAYMADDPLGQTYVDAFQNGDLTARTTLLFPLTSIMKFDKTVEKIKRRRAELESHDSSFIRADQVKLFLDGVILSHTAAMLEPYEGEYGKFNFKAFLFSDEKLFQLCDKVNKAGFGLYFHTVGDGATRQALNTIERIVSNGEELTKTPSISHLAVVSQEDASRFAQLGVMVNSQFYWGKHQEIIEQVENYIGPERSKWIFPYGGIARAGGTLVAGSDWPISTPNPFYAMQVSATRPITSIKKPEDEVWGDGREWLPEHKVDVETMIKAFTIEGAKLQSWDDIIGSIEVGKRADLIMVNQNLLTIPKNKIHETEVLLTMLDGKIIYEHQEQ